MKRSKVSSMHGEGPIHSRRDMIMRRCKAVKELKVCNISSRQPSHDSSSLRDKPHRRLGHTPRPSETGEVEMKPSTRPQTKAHQALETLAYMLHTMNNLGIIPLFSGSHFILTFSTLIGPSRL